MALAVFAAVGGAVLDDYGVAGDEYIARGMAITAVEYVLGDGAPLARVHDRYVSEAHDHDRYYGVAFGLPLFLVERALGLTDSRAIYLSRRLLTHLFFLTGGWFCYLLTWRLLGDRWLALFALLLFLLQPRLYAHSFFNSKDLSFVAMFMIALYLAQRAFRRDTVAAFALCGVGVGVLVNLRVMGLALFAAVAALRALDLAQARGPAQRRRALASAAAFVLAAAATLYATTPYMWRDPFAFVDAVTTLSRHPSRLTSLFQGERVGRESMPPHYLPTWMAITTPPATLLLCLVGAAAAVARGSARPRRAVGNTDVRFALLLLACLALPVVAVAALRSTMYNGWRHMHFLHAPLCLLAVYGLRALLAAAPRPRLRRRGWARPALFALAAAALAGTAAEMVRLHPYQHAYFNLLMDRRTPERLRTQYQMLYWGTEVGEGLEFLLDRFPDSTIHVDVLPIRLDILPAAARRRIAIPFETGRGPDFFISTTATPLQEPHGPVLHSRRIYGNTVLAVTAVDLSRVDAATAAPYRAAYRAAAAGAPLVRLRSEFDLYLEVLDGVTLTWVKEPCYPEDTAYPFLVRTVPVNIDDISARRLERGWKAISFRFGQHGVRFDGRCLIQHRLSHYPVRAIEVGRHVPAGRVIEAAIDLRAAEPAVGLPGGGDAGAPAWSMNRYRQAHAAIAAGEWGAPAARAAFDLYLDAAGTALAYHKDPCAAADLRERFFLHLVPADTAELDAVGRQAGFDNRGFDWREYGVLLDSACVALVPLPHYTRGIARIRTGQFTRGQGQRWNAEITDR